MPNESKFEGFLVNFAIVLFVILFFLAGVISTLFTLSISAGLTFEKYEHAYSECMASEILLQEQCHDIGLEAID